MGDTILIAKKPTVLELCNAQTAAWKRRRLAQKRVFRCREALSKAETEYDNAVTATDAAMIAINKRIDEERAFIDSLKLEPKS